MKKGYLIKNEATNDFSATGSLEIKVGPKLGKALRGLIVGNTNSMSNENQMSIQFVAGNPMTTINEEDGFLVKVGSGMGSVLVKLGDDFLLTGASLSAIDKTTVLVNLNIGEVSVELIETDNVKGAD